LTTITLSEVNRTNWRTTLQLSVHPDQQRFVADYVPIAAIALAKAFVRPQGMVMLPYAIYADDQMVGFMELAYKPDSHDSCWVYHFFIDQAFQGKGYGKQALFALIQLVKAHHPLCQHICLTAHPENTLAQHLYTGLGFQPTGQEIDGELVYDLIIS
jgi:diamine N-acetyltransferase